jgi:hypothetical protein
MLQKVLRSKKREKNEKRKNYDEKKRKVIKIGRIK